MTAVILLSIIAAYYGSHYFSLSNYFRSNSKRLRIFSPLVFVAALVVSTCVPVPMVIAVNCILAALFAVRSLLGKGVPGAIQEAVQNSNYVHSHGAIAAAEPHIHHDHEHLHPGTAGGDVVHSHPHTHLGSKSHQHAPDELEHYHVHEDLEPDHQHGASRSHVDVTGIGETVTTGVALTFFSASALALPGPFHPNSTGSPGGFTALVCFGITGLLISAAKKRGRKTNKASSIAAFACIAASAALLFLTFAYPGQIEDRRPFFRPNGLNR